MVTGIILDLVGGKDAAVRSGLWLVVLRGDSGSCLHVLYALNEHPRIYCGHGNGGFLSVLRCGDTPILMKPLII